jgi:hypothetical protein
MKICRPRQAPVDDLRYERLFSQAAEDFEFFGGFLVLEGNKVAIQLSTYKTQFDELIARRNALLQGNLAQPQRFVALREINGSILERWRMARQIARFGGVVKSRYTTQAPDQTDEVLHAA